MHEQLSLEVAVLALCNKGSIFNFSRVIYSCVNPGVKGLPSIYGVSWGDLDILDN